jgi:hypothetical protein
MEPLLGVQQLMKSSAPPPHSQVSSPHSKLPVLLIVVGAKKVMGVGPGGRNVNMVLEIEYTFLGGHGLLQLVSL